MSERLFESHWYLWWWQAHRIICWFIGHNWHELPRDELMEEKYIVNTKFCPRCLKFVCHNPQKCNEYLGV